MDHSTLILLTSTYPFSRGEEFLDTELPYLSRKFDKVILFPQKASGMARPLPERVEVDLSLARPNNELYYQLRTLSIGATHLDSYREIWAHKPYLLRPRVLARIFRYLGNALHVRDKFLTFIRTTGPHRSPHLVYTYWLSFTSLGIGLAKKFSPETILVSRAHSGDVYEHAHTPPYIPFKPITLKYPDRIYCISEHCRQYLTRQDPSISTRLEVSRLGVLNPGFDTHPSNDGVFRIVSCSFITPVKRLDLLIQALRHLADSFFTGVVEWHHIGDGPLRSRLEKMARNVLPMSVHWNFHGYLPHQEVFEFYRRMPIDVFINVSRFEGIPVAIMEAQSCGIPVIATAVGATAEIVNESNGILLEPNPSPQAIAEAITLFITDKALAQSKRAASKQTWNDYYNGDENYADFSDRLASLLNYYSG